MGKFFSDKTGKKTLRKQEFWYAHIYDTNNIMSELRNILAEQLIAMAFQRLGMITSRSMLCIGPYASVADINIPFIALGSFSLLLQSALQ